jgi:hypothetical protein
VSNTFSTGPDAPFVASAFIPRDRPVRVLAVGRVKGALVQTQARFGDIAATGRRPERQQGDSDG